MLQAAFIPCPQIGNNAWEWFYGKHDEQEFTGLNIVWVETILDGLFWIAIIRVGIFQVGIFYELSWVGVFQVWIFQVGVILSGNFPGGNYPCGSYPGWELSRWDLSWVGIFFGGGFPGGNFLGGIIRVGIFRVGVFLVSSFCFIFSWNKKKSLYWQFSNSNFESIFWRSKILLLILLTCSLSCWQTFEFH